MLKISEFQTKDVVNVSDGKKLGTVVDLEIDLQQGRVDAIICPGHGKFFGLFSGGKEIIIPWRNIVKIGEDVILVRIDEEMYVDEALETNHHESRKPTNYRPYTRD